MFKIEIKGLKELQADVDDLIKSRIPKMTMLTINQVGAGLKKETVKWLGQVFDRPTSWTLNSVYFKPATMTDMSGYVWFKDDAAKGTPAVKYLWPEVHEGPRNLKRFEKALKAIGVLPDGYYTVPGAGAKIDAYGNMDRGQIIQILSYFQAFPEAGYRANMTAARKARLAKGSKRTGKRGLAYFVGRPGNDGVPRRGKDFKPASKLPLGVWQRTTFGSLGSAVKPVLLFIKMPTYKKRLPFYEWGQEYVDREFPATWARVAAETLLYRKGWSSTPL